MKCEKCGYERHAQDSMYVPATECPSCGVVYAKSSFGGLKQGSAILTQRPSPLDESTLKTARQRVEMRIRQRNQTRLKDERYALTLARSREIAAAEARKRQENREKRRRLTPDSQAGISAAGAAATPTTVKAAGKAAPQTINPDVSRTAQPETTLVDVPVHQEPEPRPASSTSSSAAAQSLQQSAPLIARKEHTAPTDIEKQPPIPLRETATRNKTSNRMAFKGKRILPAACITKFHDRLPLARNSSIVRLLPLVAWLILLAGMVGMILSWTTLKPVEAGSHALPQHGIEALPVGLLLGFAYLATGVLGFAFFWVSSLISGQLKDIRRLLLALQMSIFSNGAAEKPEPTE
jgi:hypothetical protein